MTSRWEFYIDRGGTFTDIVGRLPDGTLKTLKLLSADPERYADAALAGIRRLLGIVPDAPITADRVRCVKMGTTVATNALLERRGEPTLLVITRGFRDALRIATQARPRLFDRRITLPESLYARVIEADERVGARGDVLRPLDTGALEAELRAAFAAGLRACAIVFLHGYRYHEHELAAAAAAERVGFTQISVSHRVSPLMKLVPRGDTTVLDAYLSPILRRYVAGLARELPGVQLLFMQSSGGLVDAAHFQGKDALLSGPAGGIVGMVRTARAAGHSRVIGFDMGGTSTDVSHFAGEFERAFDTEVAGVRVRAPMLRIHTIAAGGGSIIHFDGARLRVGPASAGANPGPASYRRGGPLTITDANIFLGRIQPDFFPRVFGAAGAQPLDRTAAARRIDELTALMSLARPDHAASREQAAAGALRIAVGSMANAIKRISVARGYDVTRYTLQCFGGAGGQHACLVADVLGMTRIFIHPLAGVLSAHGMGLADQLAMRERALELPLDPSGLAAADLLGAELLRQAAADLRSQGATVDERRSRVTLLVKYRGTDTVLPCVLTRGAATADIFRAFEDAYRRHFAFVMPGNDLIIEAVSVESAAAVDADLGIAAVPDAGTDAATMTAADPGVEAGNAAPGQSPRLLPSPAAVVSMYCWSADGAEAWRDSGVYRSELLSDGACIPGPAILADRNATTVVDPGWECRVGADGSLSLERVAAHDRAGAAGVVGAAGAKVTADPILLEVFNNLFMNIAEQMGLSLQNTAHSVNIKERLDFSCALFDAGGALIANAPHMPVHLGSMSESVRSVIERNRDMRPGDVYVLNDPYHGGTHLPDITVITPVYLDGPRPSFFTASRGHHADIGGITPGSMPPFSASIADEGVLIDNFRLVERGELRALELAALLHAGPHPARNPPENLADMRAQIAANEKGAQELRAMVEEYGHVTVARYMGFVQDNAEESVRQVIGRLHGGSFSLPLDNGAQIRVAVTVDTDTRSASIDFTGTSAQLPNNFNAPKAITIAAVLYVFRTLVDDDIPLNAGCLNPLTIIVPEGCMLNPRPPAAVVAGNVETSMCVTNALYGALGIMAAAQCTMNNFTFGNERHQYYETIAGGSGAGPGFDGTGVVQTHMTNSRLTDPEVLEFRLPVRLDSFAIRTDSGGPGRWRGGDGGIRRMRFLEPMTASILSNGRQHGAFGMAGGGAGAPGENHIERADGRIERLGHIGQAEVGAGDVFVITTPGGGGYGVLPT